MFKEFLMKKMLEKQMAGIPEEEKQRFIKMIEKNPELFSKIGASIEEKVKSGKTTIDAAKEVAGEFKDELSKITAK